MKKHFFLTYLFIFCSALFTSCSDEFEPIDPAIQIPGGGGGGSTAAVFSVDFNGATLAEVEDEIRFKQARPGDHLCTLFQCPNCQSYNIRGKAINPNLVEDLVFECMVVRATLDSFWS